MAEIIERNRRSEQYLRAAMKTFRQSDDVSDSGTKMLVAHLSDIHGDWERLDSAIELFNYLKPDFAVHTGDTVKWSLDHGYGYFNEKLKDASFPLYNCIGNHDTYGGGEYKTNAYLHDAFVAPLKNTDGKDGYYRTDFDRFGVRLIVLNNYDYFTDGALRKELTFSNEQCKWLCDVLKDSADRGYAVIIASHETEEPIRAGANDFGFCQRCEPHPWGTSPKAPHIAADVVDAFKHAGSVHMDYEYPSNGQRVRVDVDFNKEGRFICYLSGHRHGDYIGYLDTYPDQLSICMTCSGCEPADYHNIGEEISDLPRVTGTVTEDALNLYAIDLEANTLSVVRFGAYVNDLAEERLFAKFKF